MTLFLTSAIALAFIAAPAGAAISPAATIEGPGPDVLDLGGVAMAEDGTGGLVYRKRTDGRAHVFAAQFTGGRWRAPQRVDGGQQFDSSWPRIGAANGGRLVVTWVHEFGMRSDRLFSASLDPGASRFQPPVPIDLNVGEASSTFPSLAMNRGGSAYISYVVLTESGTSGLPPGYVRAETRVARYNGSLWSTLGSPVNRNPSSPVTSPTAANAPKVGIDVTGNGLVGFQEPDDEFVDRIWARRIFGSNFGVPLLASPQTLAGVPLRGAADAFSLAESGFGQAAIAFRQQPGERSPLNGIRVMVNTIPEAFSPNAGQFTGPRLLDGPASAAPAQSPAAPIVGVTPDGVFSVVYGLGPASMLVEGDDTRVRPAERLDDGRGSVPGNPALELADSGSAVVAWRARRATLAVEERGLAAQSLRPAAAAAGGEVTDVQAGGSGLGDAVVGFTQGDPGRNQVGATVVDAPPLEFAVQTPIGWVRSRRVRIGWDPAPNAIGSVRYSVTVGDDELANGLAGNGATLRTRALGNGRKDVIVIARDSKGQETESLVGEMKIDRRRPRVRARRSGRRAVVVAVTDGSRRRNSGLRAGRTRILFGDGRRARGRPRVRHRYRRPGVYRVVVRAQDRAGNRTAVKRTVRVR